MPSGAQIQGPPGENRFFAVYDDGSAMDCTFPTLALCRAAINGVTVERANGAGDQLMVDLLDAAVKKK